MGCAQGTDVWVRVPASRQAQESYNGRKRSALHWASEKGLAGTVAQLLAHGADATLTDQVRAGISVYRYPHVLICICISTNTIVCNTAWKPERSSLVSFLIVRDNTGQARTSLDPASGHERDWYTSGYVYTVCVCVCACARVRMYVCDVFGCMHVCVHACREKVSMQRGCAGERGRA